MSQTTVVALLGGMLLGAGTATARTAQRPDLSGRWTFNAAQSDNPRTMLQGADSGGSESRGGRPDGGGGGAFGGRGGFGRRGGLGRRREGGGPGGMSDEQRQRMRQTMQLVLSAPAAFTIAETDSSVTFVPDSGAALALASNGRKVTQKVEGSGDVEIKGHWQGNDFVVERKLSGGGKVTEDYLRSQDGRQLYVIVGFDGGRGRSLDFRRVYDGAPATQPNGKPRREERLRDATETNAAGWLRL